MPLNIEAAQSNAANAAKSATPDATPVKPSARARRGSSSRLVAEVLDELTAWNPREFIAAFQRWHQGQISLIQLNVLAFLEASGPLPMNRLAEALDISVASLTGVIDRMEARDLVARRRDVEDRRVILVEPGEGGRRVFAEIDQRRRSGLATLLGSLSDAELSGLLEGHRALRAARIEMARRLSPDKVDALVARAKDARAKAERRAKVDEVVARAKAARVGKIEELVARAKGGAR